MPRDDSSKRSLAIEETELERRARLQAESHQALKAYRDSSADIPLFDDEDRPTSPTIIIHNHPHQRSLKPAPPPKDSWNPSTVRGTITKWVLIGLALASGLAAGLFQALK